MSIAVLNQVYDEMRRLAIAGSNLASGDFRLKKLIPPLEKSGAKAPVFAKVAESIQQVVDSTSENASAALLDLSTLVTAILYTQGETGAEGKLQAIETEDFGLPTSNSSARVLKPLIEALTTTGSGRLEIVRDAQERGAFKDLRLVRMAVEAIDDVYGELADFIADNVLPLYGKTIYSGLRDSIELKGKGGHVRRLRVLHRLDPEATHELVEQALESGSKEMKITAIECLAGSKEHLSYLLGQTQAKNKDVRRVALNGIAEFKNKEVVETLQKALSGPDLDLAIGPASRNSSPKLLAFLLEDGKRQFEELFAVKAKAKLNNQLNRFHTFLACFNSRTDKKSDSFLVGCFDQRDELAKLKGTLSGRDIVSRIAGLFVQNNSKTGQSLLIDEYESFEGELLNLSLLAAVRIRRPKEVFDLYSPFFLSKTTKKKGNDPNRENRELVRRTIQSLARGHRFYYYEDHSNLYNQEATCSDWIGKVKLDPRWLDVAVKLADLEAVMALARPRHKGANDFLAKTLKESLKKKSRHLAYEFSSVLETMVRVNHPDVTECYLEILEKTGTGKTQRNYYAYGLLRLVPDLPKKAIPKIEALIPSLNENLIDEIIPYLDQLKAKS